MNLEIYFESPLDFHINFDGQQQQIKAGTDYAKFTYQPEFNKEYNLVICCDNTEIVKHNIEIKRIIFDDYWIIENERVAFGKNTYSDEYVKYAVDQGVPIDYTVNDNHLMFFMGTLSFTFRHPIYKFYENSLR